MNNVLLRRDSTSVHQVPTPASASGMAGRPAPEPRSSNRVQPEPCNNAGGGERFGQVALDESRLVVPRDEVGDAAVPLQQVASE